ncbi:MAG: S8 family serine peptidase [Planctomycetes bacterium]|nr:S8 family serine peptidase [Planctomycetota bacterium]
MTRPILSTVCCAALAALPAILPAQEARAELPANAHRPATGDQTPRNPLPPVRMVEELHLPVEDDRPDFAPATIERSADGHHFRSVPKGNPYVLSFVSGDLTPEPGIDQRLLEMQRDRPTGRAYAYVMLEGRMTQAKVRTLTALGVRVFDVHTWQSVVASVPLDSLQVLVGLPFVRWIGLPLPAQKLGVRLTRELARARAATATLPIYVSLYESDMSKRAVVRTIGVDRTIGDGRALERATRTVMPHGAVQRAFATLGFRPVAYDASLHVFRGPATVAQIRALQERNDVRTLELAEAHFGFHDQTMAMIGQDRVRGKWNGSGVSVGIIDTGIDSSPYHLDFDGKGLLGFRSDNSLPDPFEDGHGHGTHVTGTVCGHGKVDPRYTGAAPRVGHGEGNRLFIGRYIDDTNNSAGDPKVLFDAFRLGYTNNGRENPKPSLVNNSWGNMDQDGYTGTEKNCRSVDEVVYESNQTYLFASGNKMMVPNEWAASPGVAKNSLTIGATTDMPGKPGAGASYSRFGVRDGRQKPDVCAPGDEVTSTRLNSTTGYANRGGTSMACPTVTGALASVLQREPAFAYFPAGVKAAAIGSATIDGTMSLEGRRGFGQIDAYKLNEAGKTSYQVFGGTLAKSGSFGTLDIPIDPNTVAIRVVLVMVEPQASSLAAQARRNDVQLWIDLPPYSGRGNSGEFSAGSSNETVITFHSNENQANGLVVNGRGKTVRFKAYAESVKLLDSVKFAICVMQYFRAPSTQQKPALEVLPASAVLEPGATLTLLATLRSDPTVDDMTNARIWLDSPATWSMLRIDRQTFDKILQRYDSNNTHPSSYPKVETGPNGGMTLGSGPLRDLTMAVQAPSQRGWYDLVVAASFHAANQQQQLSQTVRVCVDDQDPAAIQNLKTSYPPLVWTADDTIAFTFDQAVDRGCAGLAHIHYRFSPDGLTPPDTNDPSTASTIQTKVEMKPGSHAQGRWFQICALDRAGHWGPVAKAGPFYIDHDLPVLSDVTIDKGAASTATTSVSVGITATDAHSGLQNVRLSLDQTTWGAWQAIPGGAIPVDLADPTLGGSGAQGLRIVRVQVRDKAGNLSAVRSDTIQYYKVPTLTGATVKALPNVTADHFVIHGTDLNTVTAVLFDNRPITAQYNSAHDSAWATGYMRNMGANTMWFYPPQGLQPGFYNFRVQGITGTSNPLVLTITSQPQKVIRSAAKVFSGLPHTLLVSRGDQPAGATAVILASTSNRPSVLPGVYHLGIGNNFTDLVMVPPLPFDKFGVATLAFPVVPSMVGVTAYFQAAYLDQAAPTWPIPVSDVWQTDYVK